MGTRAPKTAFKDASERKNERMLVHGIPSWMNGTYVRNGPGTFRIGTQSFRHLFDGYATVLRVRLDGTMDSEAYAQVTVRNLRTLAYQNAMKEGRMKVREFGTMPNHPHLWSKAGEVLSTIATALVDGEGVTDNASVHVVEESPGCLLAMTETRQGTYLLDEESLDIVSRLNYARGDGIRGDMTTAHPWWDERERSWINYSVEVGKGYHVWSRTKGTDRRKKLATIQARKPWNPCWMHSFAASKNKVLLAEQPMYLNLAAMTLGGRYETEYYNFDWHPQDGTRLNLLDRRNGWIETLMTDPFFFFHFINAYDEEDGMGFVADVVAYRDPEIVRSLSLDNMIRPPSTRSDLPEAKFLRLTIRDGRCSIEERIDLKEAGRFLEYPTIRSDRTSIMYRYVYGVCATTRPACVANGLCKIDVESGRVMKTWEEPGVLPGEPCFVPCPGKEDDEDDGIVLSVLHRPCGRSELLFLDGKTFMECTRLDLGTGIPYGFHGSYVDHGSS